MKNLFMRTFLLLQSITLLPVLEATTRKIVHRNIQVADGDQYILGGEITNADVTVGIFKVERDNPIFVIEYQEKNIHIRDIYQHIRDILHDAQEHHNIVARDACFAIPGVARGDLFLYPHMPWNTSDDVARHADTSQRGVNRLLSKFINYNSKL